MGVKRIEWRWACRKRLEVLLRSLQCPLNACIDVVTLLEVYVFKEVPADRSGGNRVAVHLDSLHMRNRSFHRHQPLAQIFIDTWGVVSSCHSRLSSTTRTPSFDVFRGHDDTPPSRKK